MAIAPWGWLTCVDENPTILEARRIPEPGQVFTFYGFRFQILRRQRNQISSVRVNPPPAENAEVAVA